MPSLAEIEREFCRRIGPADQLSVASSPASTASLVYVTDRWVQTARSDN